MEAFGAALHGLPDFIDSSSILEGHADDRRANNRHSLIAVFITRNIDLQLHGKAIKNEIDPCARGQRFFSTAVGLPADCGSACNNTPRLAAASAYRTDASAMTAG